MDGNIASEGGAGGGGPIDSELAKITDRIQAIDSKIDGAGGAGAGAGDLAAPVSSFMGSEMYKLEVGCNYFQYSELDIFMNIYF